MLSVMGISIAAPETIPFELHGLYDSGVEYYRNGDYDKALKCFKQLSKATPLSQEVLYYYAITLAQMGRFKEAKKTYEEVISIGPDTESSALARQGIDYLPIVDQLDMPPQFKKPIVSQPESSKTDVNAEPVINGQNQDQLSANNSPPGNMDSKTMEMMLLMGSMGNGGMGGGFNPMIYSMMQNMTRKNIANGETNTEASDSMFSSDIIKTMMMNQMMQDFSPFGQDKNY